MRMRFRGRLVVDPAILEAGSVVANERGVPRRDVFRSMRTADVLAEALRLSPEHVLRAEMEAALARIRHSEREAL